MQMNESTAHTKVVKLKVMRYICCSPGLNIYKAKRQGPPSRLLAGSLVQANWFSRAGCFPVRTVPVLFC